VEHQERPKNHHRITRAEHVRARPAGGDGEDIAEKRDVRVLDEVRVRERAGLNVQARGRQRRARRRHHPAVRCDGDEVHDPAEREHPDEPQLQVPQHEGGGEAVGQQVHDSVHGRSARGHDGHDQHLHAERHQDQPNRPQLDLRKGTKPSSCRRDGQEEQEEGQGEGHSGGGGAITHFSAPRRTTF